MSTITAPGINDVDYHRYLASREWALKREAVRERSGNRCERCWTAPQEAVHHLSYQHLGDEPLSDLQAICRPCHAYLSGKVDNDPIHQIWPPDQIPIVYCKLREHWPAIAAFLNSGCDASRMWSESGGSDWIIELRFHFALHAFRMLERRPTIESVWTAIAGHPIRCIPVPAGDDEKPRWQSRLGITIPPLTRD